MVSHQEGVTGDGWIHAQRITWWMGMQHSGTRWTGAQREGTRRNGNATGWLGGAACGKARLEMEMPHGMAGGGWASSRAARAGGLRSRRDVSTRAAGEMCHS